MESLLYIIYSLPPNVRSVDQTAWLRAYPPPHLNYVCTPMLVEGGGIERALAEANSVLPPHPISISPLHVNFPPPLPFSSFGGLERGWLVGFELPLFIDLLLTCLLILWLTSSGSF